MALPLNTFVQVHNIESPITLKILGLKEALEAKFAISRTAVLLDHIPASEELDAIYRVGFHSIFSKTAIEAWDRLPLIHTPRDQGVVGEGNVIRVRPSGQVSVLYRRGANANTLFLTDRCNSHCLMCSQPPIDHDDSWWLGEIFELLPLIDPELPVLGLTGGEPTLLGARLARLLEECVTVLPKTILHILTNGRNFSDLTLVQHMRAGLDRTIWAIPLYADNAAVHDYVVQSAGAFYETLDGIYNLGEAGHRLEIRIVLHRQTMPRLLRLAEFIYRNFPFVEHVALMGLEPMGYARRNRDLLWIDPADYADEISEAAEYLSSRGMAVSIYNMPLCVLSRNAWIYAEQSISDWKNVYVKECVDCAVKKACAGFFISAGPEWRSRAIEPIKEITENEEKLVGVS